MRFGGVTTLVALWPDRARRCCSRNFLGPNRCFDTGGLGECGRGRCGGWGTVRGIGAGHRARGVGCLRTCDSNREGRECTPTAAAASSKIRQGGFPPLPLRRAQMVGYAGHGAHGPPRRPTAKS